MNTSTPQLPPGWIALWDETSQRYYYLEQSTGRTQWEIPTEASKVSDSARGEADSYGSGFPQPNTGYPQQQNTGFPQPTGYPQQQNSGFPEQLGIGFPSQQSPGFPEASSGYPNPTSGYPESSTTYNQSPGYPNNTVATSYPTQQDYHNPNGEQLNQQGGSPSGMSQPGMNQPGMADGPDGERGIGKVFKGFSGGAITGTLIGFAAGKLLGNNNHHQQGGNYGGYNYAPPPPPGYGNYGPPPPQGFGGYGKPPKKHHFW